MDVICDDTRIYWTDWFRGHVFAADKAGGPRVSLATGQRFAFRSPLAVDGDFLYWATEDPNGGVMSGAVMRRHKRDESRAEILLGDQQPIGAIVLDDTHIYATVPLGGQVLRLTKDAKTVEYLETSVVQPLALGIDEDYVYWSSQTEGTLSKRAKAGGPSQIIAANLQQPVALAVDATHVYLANKGEDGTIFKVSKTGAEREPLVRDQQRPSHIAVDESHVYWTTVGGVWRADKEDGHVHRLAGYAHVPEPSNPQALEHAPMGIAVDNESVYWVDIGEVGGLYGGPKDAARRLT